MDPIISGVLQQQQEATALGVQMSVLKKSMDVQRGIGELLVGLIETASPKSLQSPAAKTPGLGEKFDVFA
ncbi:MAG: YjfB family protein [Planctomycetaceae bacterium]|jgi:hypothetical protein|nr:YjfB family protein [Planctomycetaceae bacterium]